MSRHNGQWRLHLGHGGLGAYVVVMVLTLAAAVSTQANLLFWILGLLLAAALLSLVIATFSIRGLMVERLLPPHGITDQPLTLRYRLSRRGRRVPLLNAVIRETWAATGRAASTAHGDMQTAQTPLAGQPPRLAAEPIGWVAHVGNGEPVMASSVSRPLRRGALALETVEVSTTFPFGILRSTLRVTQPQSLLIYPRLYQLRDGLLERAGQQAGQDGPSSHEAGGQDEFYGLREYRPGDGVAHIDWKHSARTNKLITREMTRSAPPRLLLQLDLDRRRLDQLASTQPTTVTTPQTAAQTAAQAAIWIEAAIDLAASFVVEASKRGFALGLTCPALPGLDIPPHHSQPHRDRLLRALALIDVSQARVVVPPDPGPRRLRPTVTIVPGPHTNAPHKENASGVGLVLASADLERLVRGPAPSGALPPSSHGRRHALRNTAGPARLLTAGGRP